MKLEGNTITLDAQRVEIWGKRDEYIGKLVRYRFQKHGTKDKPRCPVFLGFRAPEDMS